jgi:hypothetical protein
MEQEAVEKSAVAIRHLRSYSPEEVAAIGEEDFLFDSPGVESVASACGGVVLADGDEQRASTLLTSGAPLVFVGEAAVRDSEVVTRLCADHGAERIGIFAPVRRQAVSWSFETTSNADFKTVTPSFCEPAWEILKADGTPTGALAPWWLTAMRDLGATQLLVQAAIGDDTDLNLCADLVERLGDNLWLTPTAGNMVPLTDWVQYGQARHLALPNGMDAL